MCEEFQEVEWVLVQGNHDMIPEVLLRESGIQQVGRLDEGPLTFTHDPADLAPDFGYHVCGHVHPGIRLAGAGRQRLRLRCFHITDKQAVMPAYGAFTGMYTIDPAKQDRCSRRPGRPSSKCEPIGSVLAFGAVLTEHFKDVTGGSDAVAIDVGWARIGDRERTGSVIEIGRWRIIEGDEVGASEVSTLKGVVRCVRIVIVCVEVGTPGNFILITDSIEVSIGDAVPDTVQSRRGVKTAAIIKGGPEFVIAGHRIDAAAGRSDEKRVDLDGLLPDRGGRNSRFVPQWGWLM